MEWWAQGHTFSNSMRVLHLGAYDAILGYDWLSAHSPMLCDWQAKILKFVDAGVQVSLSGISQPLLQLQELPAEQFVV